MYNMLMRCNGVALYMGLKMKNFCIGFLVFAAWVCLMLASFDVFTK